MTILSGPQAALLVVATTGSLWLLRRRRRNPLPPGPPGLPLIGNLLDMPTASSWVAFTKWGETYGPLIHINVLGRSIVIINSLEVATEILDKRSSNYSDRLMTPMMELAGLTWSFILMGYGEGWRLRRKLFHSQFHGAVCKSYYRLQEAVTRDLLRRLLESPDQFSEHIRTAAGSTILEIVYGHRVAPKNDRLVALAEEGMASAERMTRPGKHAIDMFPFLKYVPDWVPGAGFKKAAARNKQLIGNMRDIPFNECKEKMENSTAVPSFVTTLLSQSDTESESRPAYEKAISESAASAYGAGSDTVVAAMRAFILLMVLHPDVQRKAQAEIDSVIGRTRLPEMEDVAELPYVEALLKEVFRIIPVAPIGVPHRSMEDDVYDGYFIPGRSIVIANAWAMLRDPSTYSNPGVFNPERFLGENCERDPRTGGVFGFGRRVCPGKTLAESSVFIAIASILATFDIGHAKDEEGRVIPVEMKQVEAALAAPAPFRCSIKPRSVDALQVLDHYPPR